MGVGGSPPLETAEVFIGQLQSRQGAAEQMKDEAKLAVMRKDGVVGERLEPGGGGDLEVG